MFLLPAAPARRRPRHRFVLAVAATVAGWLVVPVAPTLPAAADGVIGNSAIGSPYEGAVLTPGVPVIIAGPAYLGSDPIVSVEVSVDGGQSWADAQVAANGFWSLVYTPTEPGELTIVARSATAYESLTGDPVHVTVGGPAEPVAVRCSCEFQLPVWRDEGSADYDGNPVEVGLRFRTDRDGAVTGLMVWRFPFMDSIVGRLWSADGTLLAQQVVPAGTESSVTFPHPVPIRAGQTYVASYYTASGHYRSSEGYFAGALEQPPFEAVYDERGGAGVYHYDEGGGFPTDNWHDSNYWVAPVLTTY